MYTTVEKIHTESYMSNAATWPGLIRHTALAGHVILVGSAYRVSRFVPSFRDAKLAVTTLTELNELEASLLCSFQDHGCRL